MRHGRFKKVALWVSVITLAGAGALIAPRKAGCTASGCSFVTYGTPTWYAGCYGGGNSGCYDCEYAGSTGYTWCHESAAGDIKICYDYQSY